MNISNTATGMFNKSEPPETYLLKVSGETGCSVDAWNPFQRRVKPVLLCSVGKKKKKKKKQQKKKEPKRIFRKPSMHADLYGQQFGRHFSTLCGHLAASKAYLVAIATLNESCQ